MPNYIMLVNLTDQGVRGVKDIPRRQAASREMVKKLGIERKQVFMTFGPYDFVHILEAPDDQAMSARSATSAPPCSRPSTSRSTTHSSPACRDVRS